MKFLITLISLLLSVTCRSASLRQDTIAVSVQKDKSISRDERLLDVVVYGKDRTQQLREGALSVNAVNVADKVNTITDITELINRTAGVKVRSEGGIGADLDVSINGLSGNSIRYFIDGVPLDTKGNGMKLSDIPVNLIQRVEIYKGVVPSSLGIDALGGAVNIITRQERRNFLDASYTAGSFATHQANINAQYVERRTGLILRPVVAYNYSRNNYTMKDIEVWDESSRKYVHAERKRFHDAYSSFLGQMEVGVQDKPWADAAFLSASYHQMHKDMQTGATQSRVYGMAERESKAWNVAARYAKKDFPLHGMDVRLSLSHTWDNSITTDTCYRKYDWNGDYILASRNEITGRERSRRHYGRPLTVGLANIGYTFSDNHQLDFNYSVNRIGNRQWDEVSEAFLPSNDLMAKHVLALTYNQMLLNDRMQNTFFVKDYVNYLHVEQKYAHTITNADAVMGSNTKNFWGAGAGLRYAFMPQMALKASYERSVRLPLSRELLGNASTIYPNLALAPEQSSNWNLCAYGTFRPASGHSIGYDINAFVRNVDNYIQPTVSEKEGMMQYDNLPGISVKGVEAEVRYAWQGRLNAMCNFSWQDARDRMKVKSDGKPSATYNNRVPNRPWLYLNSSVDYAFRRVLCTTDRVKLSVDYQWVHWYYLTWEAYGYAKTKARIPEQHVVDVAATYSVKDGMYNITLGCDNVLDHILYDKYRLQKPGRYVFVKLRVVI